MRRYRNLETEPHEARRTLRERLERDLAPRRERHVNLDLSLARDPSLVLDVIEDVTVSHTRLADTVRARYQAARISHPNAASFDELVERGVLRVVWGIADWPYGLRRAAEVGEDATSLCLRAIVAIPHSTEVELGERARARLTAGSDRAGAAVLSAPNAIERYTALERWATKSLAKGWVTARLWTRSKDDTRRLRWWFDHASIVDNLFGEPHVYWTSELLDELSQEILALLESELDLQGWNEEAIRCCARLAVDRGSLDVASVEDAFAVPVDRYARFEWIEKCARWDDRAGFAEREEVFALARVLLRSADVAHARRAPCPTISDFVELAAERPVLWTALAWEQAQRPALLADLLLDSSSCAWALDAIAQRRVDPVGYDLDAVMNDRRAPQHRSFQDGVEVALHSFRGAPEEVGRGFAWVLSRVHGRTRSATAPAGQPEFASELWGQLANAARSSPERTQRSMIALVGHAIHKVTDGSFESPWTAVLLDALAEMRGIVDAGTVEGCTRAALDAYTRLFAQEKVDHELLPLPPSVSARFVQAVTELEASRQILLWRPTNFCHRIINASRLGENERSSTQYTIVHLLRTHVRLLARAIAGWSTEKRPEALLHAFREALDAAIVKASERGLLGAFDAFFEISLNNTGTMLAEDVGRAVSALPQEKRADLLVLLERLTEPAVLAALVTALPGPARAQMLVAAAKRVDGAPSVQTIREIHARVERLLDAGMVEEAQRLLMEEPSIPTWGPVEERDVWRFRMHLRIDLACGRLQEILDARVPETMHSIYVPEAEQTLDFFRGLAEFRVGSIERAEETFERLHQRFPEIAAYAVNLHASRTARIVRDSVNEPIPDGPLRHTAERVLADGDRLMVPFREVLLREGDLTYEGNRLLLHFALGQYALAARELEALGEWGEWSERLWSYQVIALIKLGRVPEARARLDSGRTRFGHTEHLREAQRVLDGAAPPLLVDLRLEGSRPDVVRSALGELRQLQPGDQANACNAESLHRFIVRQVREACGRVCEQVPILVGINETNPKEDRVRELVRAFLSAKTSWLGWSWHGDDPGGYAKKQHGERDLCLRAGGLELAICEAVRVFGITQGDQDAIREHFLKLFGYTHADLMFLLVWSFTDDSSAVSECVCEIARRDHSGVIFRSIRPLRIHPGDSAATKGFISIHDIQGATKHVVHLIVDLKQTQLRSIARSARH